MTAEPILVACDPGASGAIAWLKPGVGLVVFLMPGEFGKLTPIVNEIENDGVFHRLPIRLYLEKVTGYVAPQKKDGEDEERENRQPGHAMFTFGKNVGAVEMAFRMIGAEIIEVPPKTWQNALFLKKDGRSKPDWKRALRDSAQRYFPGIKVTLKTADALLILRYASLKEGRGGIIVPGTPQKHAGEALESRTEANSDPSLFKAMWRGIPWILRRGEKTDTLLHKASPWEIEHIPEGKPR